MSILGTTLHPKKRLAIIGGGISGLSAAWHAERADFEVELFEASAQLGGVLGTIDWNGRLIEGAADNFATLDDEALQWCRKMGLEHEFISPSTEHRLAMVLHHGVPKPIPAGFSLVQPTRVWPIITTPVLSLSGKLRLLVEYFVPKRRQSEDESLYDFALRRLGKEAFERLVEPIVGGIFTADPKRLSMQATLPQFVQMEKEHGGLMRGFLAQLRKRQQSQKTSVTQDGRKRTGQPTIEQQASGARYAQFLAPKQGMTWWIDAIERQLSGTKIHRNAKVLTLVDRSVSSSATHAPPFSGSRWELNLANGDRKQFDGVVIATPSATTARLLQTVDVNVASKLAELRTASSVVVAMIIRRQDVTKMAWCFGIVIPQIEKRNALAVSFTGLKYPGRVPDDELLVRVFMGGSQHPEMMNWSDEDLTRTAVHELSDMIGWKGSPLWSRVLRWVAAMPQYDVGHVERIAKIESLLDSVAPTLRVAGAAYSGVGIPQCVRSGRRAIEKISAAMGVKTPSKGDANLPVSPKLVE